MKLCPRASSRKRRIATRSMLGKVAPMSTRPVGVALAFCRSEWWTFVTLRHDTEKREEASQMSSWISLN